MPVWLTLLLSTVIPAVPKFIPFLPTPVAAALTAIAALGGSLYHLYQPSPSAPPAS